MAKLKFNHIRHTIISTQKSTTIMPGISQLLNNRLIGKKFSSAVSTMFKREDYKLTIHDIVFSKWRNLIRHNDWKDFNNRKERVRRYRHEDLPPQRCTGLYELGVGVIGQDQGQNFDPDNNVLGVYVGQCVDVRSRLQDYGRRGGHLPSGLYEDIFSEGYSVFYRWAPMGSKWEAAAIEGMLLSKVDYAWNTCSNGERRHLELPKKLPSL
ncbi:unnamed protein product [Arabidopsis thaliana]|uniref:GIY-YIG domain-containing protein n=1 Tax=Arabidopsis thaliana TaxID=3702 RepID=A0A654GBV9_ARATH|nr:unnamed protein product [Arabidopsis thaliana]